MKRTLGDFLHGYVKIRITGSHYDRFLNLCAYRGVRLRELRPAGESYEAYILRSDFKRLKAIVKKSHTAVSVQERYGLPFFLHRNRKRKTYAAGILAALLFMAWLSAHVWNISIEGNLSQTDDRIFEYLDQAGVSHGMWKSAVDCRALADELRDAFAQFSWVAVKLRGTQLVISVKEGISGEEGKGAQSDEDAQEACGLAAVCAGTVESIYVRSGRPLVQAGDAVEPGMLLVSGLLPIYDDSKALVTCQKTAADADIVIRRTRSYRDVLPRTALQKFYTGKKKRRFGLRIGGLSLALPQSGAMEKPYELVTRQTQLRLFEHFYLPVYLQETTAREYEKRPVFYEKEECRRILNTNFQYFLKNLQEKGVQIFENDVKIKWNEKSAIASGSVTTGEAAVRRVPAGSIEEEIPDYEFG